jgi:hypothetical protein
MTKPTENFNGSTCFPQPKWLNGKWVVLWFAGSEIYRVDEADYVIFQRNVMAFEFGRALPGMIIGIFDTPQEAEKYIKHAKKQRRKWQPNKALPA